MKDKIDLDSEGAGPCGQGEFVDTTNYSECIPWREPEALLVLGGVITGGPYTWLDFMVPGSAEYTHNSHLVIDVLVDEEMYQKFIKTFGTGAMLFKRSGGQGGLTRAGWKQMMGTDGLTGMIIKELNRQIVGGGVHTRSAVSE